MNEEKLEIYFNDLNEKGKEKVKNFYGIKNPEEINADSFPIFELDSLEEEFKEL